MNELCGRGMMACDLDPLSPLESEDGLRRTLKIKLTLSPFESHRIRLLVEIEDKTEVTLFEIC